MKQLLPILFLLFCGASQSSAQCTATVNAGNPNVCSGDSVYLTATPTGQANYEWFVNGVSVGSQGSSYMTQNLPAGTYIFEVEITDNTSCVAMSAPFTIVVDQSPVITVSNNGPLCVGDLLQLSSTVTNATSFEWNGPAGYYSTAQNPAILNIQQNQAGVYSLYATNGTCDAAIGTNVVVNGPNATVVASADTGALCSGGSTMFFCQVTNLTGVTYSWTGPNNFTSTSPNPWIFGVTVADAGIYTLTVTGQGCSGPTTISDTALLTVGTSPVVTASAGTNPCVGGTIQLTGTVSTGTYNWTGPNGFSSTLLSPSITNAQLVDGGSYTLHANNNGCTGSSSVSVTVLSNSPSVLASTSGLLCTVDSFMGNSGASINAITSGLTGVTYSWAGPNGFSSTTAYNDLSLGTSADAGTYTVNATGTGCAGVVTVSDQVFLSGAACDSVWPGDADNSFEVTNWDLMNIGLAYGATGPARVGATNNWVGQYATDWNTNFYNGINHKYADCNGDGVVNGNDSVAVLLNYGQWHNKGVHVPTGKSTAFPDLYFDVSGVMLTPGATVNIPIKLGTGALSMQNIYGIAASIKVQGVSPTTPMTITPGGWMGNNTNSMSVAKTVSNSQTDWTLVRTDHNNVSGDGTIAVLTFTVPVGSDNQTATFYFENVLMVNNNGEELEDYNLIDENSIVYPVQIDNTITPVSSVLVVPNPSDAQANLLLSLAANTKLSISITDVTGRMVWNSQQQYNRGLQNISLPASEVAAGIYNIQLRDDKGSMVQNLKWVKK